MQVKYNIKDIPEDKWHKRALEEAQKIKTNPKDKDRDLEDDIYPKTKRGHGSEWFGMLFLKHTDNTAKWQDTYDEDGEPVDHKTSVSEFYLTKTIHNYEDALNDKSSDWHINRAKNMPKRVYGWINRYDDYHNKTYSNEYILHGIYEYDKKTKKMVYIDPQVWYNS